MPSSRHLWLRDVEKSAWMLAVMVVLLCGLYPAALWMVGQAFFPFQANGSLLLAPDGTPLGSLLIAQPFTGGEYFQPRPSAAAYDAAASASSTLAPSNYRLRDRVARALGPIVTYGSGPRQGQRVGPDVERWFHADRYRGAPHIVAQWATTHPGLARAWVTAGPAHEQSVNDWATRHPEIVASWAQENPGTVPTVADLAVVFLVSFSKDNPGRFLSPVTRHAPDGRTLTRLEPVQTGADISSIFFDMWRDEHPDVDLEPVLADMVMASGSGLDPHITVRTADYQLDRVASTWAQRTRRDPTQVREEVQALVRSKAWAPLGGLVGEPLVNVLEVNLALRNRYGPPAR